MKHYKVIDYSTGETLMKGTAEEIAERFGFPNKVAVSVYANHCKSKMCTGKRKGIIVSLWKKDDEIHEENLDILDRFYNKYYRSPTAKEFKECGGDYLMALRRCDNWCDYLELCGYDRALNYKTVEVYDPKGQLEYVGIIPYVAEDYDMSESYLRTLLCKGEKRADGYSFKYRPFDGIEV